MPNLPSAIGRGISVLVAGATVTPEQRDASAQLLDAVGETVWLASEELLDAATAISGSGPAYVFLMVEALATAGEHLGLDHTVSLRLARATVAGAGAMAVSNDPAELRRQVASPGGTTQAALEVLLEQTGFIDMIEHAHRCSRQGSRTRCLRQTDPNRISRECITGTSSAGPCRAKIREVTVMQFDTIARPQSELRLRITAACRETSLRAFSAC